MFYIGILIISFIFSTQPFIKKEVLKYFSADEYTIINTILGLLLFLTKIFYSNLEFGNVLSRDYLSYALITVTSLMTIGYSYFLNLLLKDYKAGEVMPMIRCFELIWILLVTLIFNIKEFTYLKVIGTILAATGVYLAS